MIAVVQRVSQASVTVEEASHHEEIGPGLLLRILGECEMSRDDLRKMR